MRLAAAIGRGLKLLAGIVVAILWRRPREQAERLPEVESPTLEREVKGGSRPTLAVVVLLLAAAATLAAFTVFYVVLPDTQALGLAIGLGLVLLGVALAVAGKAVVPQEQAASEYHDFGDELERAAIERVVRGSGAGVTRRTLLIAAGGAAAAAGGAATIVPLASLGPSTPTPPFSTPWGPGRAVVDPDGRAIAADEVEQGEMALGFPKGADWTVFGAPLIIIRLPVAELELPPGRQAGAPEGILAFSRICPHAGCAVSMYRHPKYEPTGPGPALVCPCHYSTFDPRRGGALEFGPAGRALPQLPLRLNGRRELEAAGDFYEMIGPSYGGVREDVPGEGST
jgi:ubiquinol-cytochrome c reductase iron-sulfur subunit